MDYEYNLEFAIKQLWLHECITHFIVAEGHDWKECITGCVPMGAHSIRTNCGREWDAKNGWRSIANNQQTIIPEDSKQPANAESAHYKFFVKDIDKLPEGVKKQFYTIRNYLDKQVAAEKEFEAFFADVERGLSAYGISPDEKSRRNLKVILKDSYGKFKRA